MRRIEKGPEPVELTNWKDQANTEWKPAWDNFRGEEKRAVKKALLTEQGHICCYCMGGIDTDSSHIEHIKSQSRSSEREKLDYGNMLASCKGEGERAGGIQEHCGHYRGNWYDPELFVTPLHPACETRFRFFADGKVRAAENDAGAQETITRLRLDYSLLEKNRKDAILGAIFADGYDMPDGEDLRILIQAYENRDSEGKFRPYCIAVLQVMREYVAPA